MLLLLALSALRCGRVHAICEMLRKQRPAAKAPRRLAAAAALLRRRLCRCHAAQRWPPIAHADFACLACVAADVYAEWADASGTAHTRVLKLLSVDPANYPDAPREGIRRVLEAETGVPHPRGAPLDTSRIASIRMGTTVRVKGRGVVWDWGRWHRSNAALESANWPCPSLPCLSGLAASKQ